MSAEVGELPLAVVGHRRRDEHAGAAPGEALARTARPAPAPPRPPRAAAAAAGSIRAASRREMPKKAASKRSMPSRKPPQRVYIVPGADGSGSKYASMSQRSAGPR